MPDPGVHTFAPAVAGEAAGGAPGGGGMFEDGFQIVVAIYCTRGTHAVPLH